MNTVMVRSLENPGVYTSNEHCHGQIIGEPRGVYIERTLSWSDIWITQGRIHRTNNATIRLLENPGAYTSNEHGHGQIIKNPGAYTSNEHCHGQIIGEPRGEYIE